MPETFIFDATLWLYSGEAAWVFVTLPIEIAEDIRDVSPVIAGFGSVKVGVRLGGTEWSTSLFPDKESGSFVLPVKRAVREAETAEIGDRVRLELTLLADR